MEEPDIQEFVTELKKLRQLVNIGTADETIVCYREPGEFLLAAMAPPDADGSTMMLAVCIAVVNAKEAVYVKEVHARPEGFDRSIPIGEDPSAVPALLMVFSDRAGLRDWRLFSYGISDAGDLEWTDIECLTAPEVTDVLRLLDEVYDLGDLRSERRDLLFRLQTNDYKVLADRRILEETL